MIVALLIWACLSSVLCALFLMQCLKLLKLRDIAEEHLKSAENDLEKTIECINRAHATIKKVASYSVAEHDPIVEQLVKDITHLRDTLFATISRYTIVNQDVKK